MKDRLSDISFPIDWGEIQKLRSGKGHTEYDWQYRYYKTFRKFSTLYRLLSLERQIPDEILLSELKGSMLPSGDSDCAISFDIKGEYKEEQILGKSYTGLIRFICKKIKQSLISEEHGYYILCRISDDYDTDGETRAHVESILNKKRDI